MAIRNYRINIFLYLYQCTIIALYEQIASDNTILSNWISDRISCHLFDTTAKNRQIDSVTVISQTWMSKRRIYIHEYPFFYSKRGTSVVFGKFAQTWINSKKEKLYLLHSCNPYSENKHNYIFSWKIDGPRFVFLPASPGTVPSPINGSRSRASPDFLFLEIGQETESTASRKMASRPVASYLALEACSLGRRERWNWIAAR